MIALVCFPRGFNIHFPGAEGVGRAVTKRIRLLVRCNFGHRSWIRNLFGKSTRNAFIQRVSKFSKAMSDTEPNSTPLVKVRDLHVRFTQKRWVLRGVNLTIPRNQTLVILGESGCGKTVLLKTIIRLVRPIADRFLFDGQDISKLTERELSKLRVPLRIFLFQGAAAFR